MVKSFAFCTAVAATLVGASARTEAAELVYTDEDAFLAAVHALDGVGIVSEGFEEEPPWDAVRTTIASGVHGASTIVSGGITWSANNQAGEITTSMGAAHSGSWGVYAFPHGDPTAGSSELIADGFCASVPGKLTAVGLWLHGTAGGHAAAIFDDRPAVSLGLVDDADRFYGVVDLVGFSTIEIRETEGTGGDQKYIFADDFTLAVRSTDTADGGPAPGDPSGFDGGGPMAGADAAGSEPGARGAGDGDELGGEATGSAGAARDQSGGCAALALPPTLLPALLLPRRRRSVRRS